MRALCSGHRRLNETLLELSVARYRRTGMATIPKLMTPRQIERGIVATPHLFCFLRAACRAKRNGSCQELSRTTTRVRPRIPVTLTGTPTVMSESAVAITDVTFPLE